MLSLLIIWIIDQQQQNNINNNKGNNWEIELPSLVQLPDRVGSGAKLTGDEGRSTGAHCLKYEANEKRVVGTEDQAWDGWFRRGIWCEKDGVLKHFRAEPDKKIFDWLVVESW